jgi:4-amino-4-deoxy-L-arabinose transferase-like glycosyltransferase
MSNQKAPNAPGNGGLIFLLVASLVISVLFGLLIPLNSNPDETSHRDYIRLLIEHKGFVQFVPVPMDTVFGDKPTPWETHQPPLYYLLCIPFHLLSGGSVFAVRMVSALLQLLTIWVTYRTCRDLFPNRPMVALGAAAFVTFLPTQAQLSAAIGNDCLTTLFCVGMFWKLGRTVQKRKPLGNSLLLGIFFGLGLLTKMSVIQLLPAFAVAYFLAVRANLLTPKEAVTRLALAIGVGVLIASPWLIRNQMLYGDPLALSIYKLTGPNYTPDQMMQLLNWSQSDYLRNVGVRSFATFWYILAPNVLKSPLPQLLIVIVLSLGGALGAYRGAKQEDVIPQRGQEDVKPAERRIVGLLALGIAFMVPFFAQFVLTVFQAQGRYFLPILLPAATICSLGWSELIGEKGKAATLLPGVILFFLTLYQLLTYR